MQIHKRVLIPFLATTIALAPVIALADPAIDELQQINESIALLKARQEQLKIQIEVLQSENQVRALQETNGTAGQPTLRSIEGADNKLLATLSIGNGVAENVYLGGMFHGWKLIDIDNFSVVITKGKERRRLTIGGAAATTDINSAQRDSHAPGPIPLPTN